MDMGESLVGAYLRQVRGCHTVAYNTFLPWAQGELDVIGVALGEGDGPVRVWLAEVAVHLNGLDYGGSGGYAATAAKVATKTAAARRYAAEVYPDALVCIELWSPIVPRGLLHRLREVEVELVVNETFTDKVADLLREAGSGTRLTGDPAFRLLQVLTHLRGAGQLRLT